MGCCKLRMVWNDMKRRCDNPNRAAYKAYGGRGIKVCKEWYNYESFKSWAVNNGYLESLLLDRINNDGNYDPNNCQFVTRFESELNKRKNKFNNIRQKKGFFEISMRRYGVYFFVGTSSDIFEAVAKRDNFEEKIETLRRNILTHSR
jgi:hypothetical protein